MKVFSVSKYIKDRRACGKSDEYITSQLLGWAMYCYGLTEDEMDAIGYLTHDDWMEERNEEEVE